MASLRNVFVIDYFFDEERRGDQVAGPRRFARSLRQQGHIVDEIYAFCVVEAMISVCRDSKNQRNKPRKIKVLRFYGHGGPGIQIVGGNRNASDPEQILAVRDGRLLHRDSLLLIRPLLSRHSRIELHGCQAGSGDEGELLLVKLANLLRVDVYASANSQISRNAGQAGRFEGVVMCAKPGLRRAFLRRFE